MFFLGHTCKQNSGDNYFVITIALMKRSLRRSIHRQNIYLILP
jgi:hypothetical protein